MKCGNCGHQEGHKANVAPLNQWLCRCVCHEKLIPAKPKRREKRIYCRYCGAKLKRDKYGAMCPEHPIGHGGQDE